MNQKNAISVKNILATSFDGAYTCTYTNTHIFVEDTQSLAWRTVRAVSARRPSARTWLDVREYSVLLGAVAAAALRAAVASGRHAGDAGEERAETEHTGGLTFSELPRPHDGANADS